jgi:catechol 2,3-dioxygenase-like lactoylglutathione lyase family enzyme
MIHHVSLESQPADVSAHRDFWTRLGFREVAPPESLRERSVWFECDGAQIHLLLSDNPDVPRRGHVAVRVDDLDALGLELEERERHWGERRVYTRAPGGHTVELFEVAPQSQS